MASSLVRHIPNNSSRLHGNCRTPKLYGGTSAPCSEVILPNSSNRSTAVMPKLPNPFRKMLENPVIVSAFARMPPTLVMKRATSCTRPGKFAVGASGIFLVGVKGHSTHMNRLRRVLMEIPDDVAIVYSARTRIYPPTRRQGEQDPSAVFFKVTLAACARQQ